jgi:hypothetical protein
MSTHKKYWENDTTCERDTSNWYRSLLCFLHFEQKWWKGHHIFFVKIIINWQACQMTHFYSTICQCFWRWTLLRPNFKWQFTNYTNKSFLLLVRFYSQFPMLPLKRSSINRPMIDFTVTRNKWHSRTFDTPFIAKNCHRQTVYSKSSLLYKGRRLFYFQSLTAALQQEASQTIPLWSTR